jgi:phage gpG-like protein
MAYEIKVLGVMETIAKLHEVGHVMDDTSSEMDHIGKYVVTYFETAVFESEGAAIGEHWSPLKADTQKEKNKKYPGRGILERTGKLRYGFQLETSATMAKITNPVPYAKYHMTGTRNMPARVFMNINSELEADIYVKFKEHLEGRIAAIIGI